MVDENDVLRNPATKRVSDRIFRQRLAEFNKAALDYKIPEKADLEHAVEAGTKCGRCAGHVRAVLLDAKPWDGGVTADLEILVSLNCVDAVGCKWEARQWRPWRKNAPLEL